MSHPKKAPDPRRSQKRNQDSITAHHMTPSLNIFLARSMSTLGQPKTIGAKRREFECVTGTKLASQSRRSVWRVTSLFEAFAAMFVVFYLLALVALSCALLFYTFNR
jgi:hypothetical protein